MGGDEFHLRIQKSMGSIGFCQQNHGVHGSRREFSISYGKFSDSVSFSMDIQSQKDEDILMQILQDLKSS